jgi:hypothetical protein
MNAANLILNLQHSGVHLSATAGRLIVNAPAGFITPVICAELTAHKPELLRLLATNEPDADGWTLADVMYDWSERAAVLEYDGGLSRADAERESWQRVMCRSRVH